MMGGTAGDVPLPPPQAATQEVSVDQLSITLRITPHSARLRVLGVAPVDGQIVQVADDRCYAPAMPQAHLVLRAVVAELDGPFGAGQIEQRILERLAVLW